MGLKSHKQHRNSKFIDITGNTNAYDNDGLIHPFNLT